MTQSYRIRDGVGFSRFAGRTIILDITADRYWQLGEDAGQLLDEICSGLAHDADDPMLARLVKLGFVAPAGDGSTKRAAGDITPASNHVPTPADSALERTVMTPGGNWMTACEVAGFALIARIALRAHPLKTILDRMAVQRERAASLVSAPGIDALGIDALARQFAHYRRLLPLRPLCLPDSIAFLWFAMRRGHKPRLVFGVEAFPFTAHCWVQDGSIVLTDALDHASRFKPILVL